MCMSGPPATLAGSSVAIMLLNVVLELPGGLDDPAQVQVASQPKEALSCPRPVLAN